MNTAIQIQNAQSKLTRGYTIGLIATVIWSSTAIFIRYLNLTYNLPPLVLAFWRDFFLAVTLGLAFAIFNPTRLFLNAQNRKFILIYGLVLSLFNSLWTISVALNGAAISTVLVYSSSAFTAVLGWWLLGEKLGSWKIAAVLLSLAGCVFVSGAYNPSVWQLNPVGVITGLISGIGFAGYSLMGKLSSERSINPWTALMYTFGIAAVFLFSYNLFTPLLPSGIASRNLFWLDGEVVGWLVLFTLALGPTLGGYGLYTVSLTYLPASVANIIVTLEPVFTTIMAFILLAERFTTPQWFGGVLIIFGIIVLRIGESRYIAPYG